MTKNKIKIKCNGLVKQMTLQTLRHFTNMSLGEVYDNVVEGKGVISKDDSEALELIDQLYALTAKLDFPQNMNRDFSLFLREQRDSIRNGLLALRSEIAKGFLPMHYRDLFNLIPYGDKDAYTHEDEQGAFKSIISHFSSEGKGIVFDSESDLSDAYFMPDGAHINYVNPKTRYERFLKLYCSNNISDKDRKERTFQKAYAEFSNLIGENLLFYVLGFSFLGDSSDKGRKLLLSQMYEERKSRLLYDDCYSVTTSHEKVSSKEFREVVEYICNIPSRADAMFIWQLKRDIEYLNRFDDEKKKIKRTWSIPRKRNGFNELKIKYQNVNKDFKLPILTLTNGLIEEEEGFYKYEGFIVEDYSNVIIKGEFCNGLQVSFNVYLTDEELSRIKEYISDFNKYELSNNPPYHKDAPKMFNKFKMDFLLRYFDMDDIDKRIQYASLISMEPFWCDGILGKLNCYNGRFIRNYSISEKVKDKK